MPYVTAESKTLLDNGADPQSAGELTYLLTRAIQKYLKGQPWRYESFAVVLGALEGARFDFEDRVLKPYENKKRVQNGDVWPCGEELPA